MNLFKKRTTYIHWQEFHNKSIWYENQSFFGKAIKITKEQIIAIIIFFCLITPFTNWMIPIVPKVIKTGISLRFN